MSQSCGNEPWNLSGLPSAKLDDIFKSQLMGLSVSGSTDNSSSSSGDSDPDPDPIVSYSLFVYDQGVMVITNLQNGETTQQLIQEDDEEGLDSKPPSFWPKVTDVAIALKDPFNDLKLEEVDLIVQTVTNLASFAAIEPLPTLVDEFEGLFNRNQKTLTAIAIMEDGANGTGTSEFDFNWVANSSALEALVLLTNSNEAKNMRKIPVGIKALISTHYASDEDIEWLSINCKSIQALMILVGVSFEDGRQSRVNVDVLKAFLKAPKFQILALFMQGTDPERLYESLVPLKELCDSFGESEVSGIRADLATGGDSFKKISENKTIDFVFSCSINRKKFKGI